VFLFSSLWKFVCYAFLGNPDFCLNREDGDYQRDSSKREFYYYACVNNNCSKIGCPQADLEFDQNKGKCVPEDIDT